uniref:Ribbon-helix-helix DNA binding domain protein n=1 Tax=Mycolicibacterium phage phi1_186018 TaxID=3236641 RepID=A0AB39AL55_9CAUD
MPWYWRASKLGVIHITMVRIKPRGPGRPKGPDKLLVPVKMLPDQRRRFKAMCAARDMTYEEMIIVWMDKEDALERRKAAQQKHPLHQPKQASFYPGGGQRVQPRQ